MKRLLVPILVVASIGVVAQTTSSLKEILLEQLKETHTKKDWFVPVNIALEGLTPEQAAWKDNSGNHSIGQLANHLIFWNSQQLANFKGEKPQAFSGNNEETFGVVDKAGWEQIVKKVDAVLKEWETVIERADEAKLKSWYSTIAKISTHNAYHTGQIIYIRKLQGSWDAEKGVK
jgi:uncharacterized damage-inducible protein DinB